MMKYLEHGWSKLFSEQWVREIWNGLLIGVCIVVLGFVALAYFFNPHEQDPKNVRSILIDLKCPEDYSNHEDGYAALENAINAYKARYMDASSEEILHWRYRFLVTQKCEETLASLRENGIFTEDDYVQSNGK